MPDSASRLINTTIKDHLRKKEEAVLRNRKAWAMLKSKGRITNNCSGHGTDGDFDWRVQFKEAPISVYTGGQTLTFAPTDRYKVATLPYRGYAMVDNMTKFDKLKNRGTSAIVKVYEEITELMMQDFESRINKEWYVDGYAAANAGRFHGIESFLGNTGVSSAVPIGVADDSYAGLDTDLAAYGGTWTGNWPLGSGDSAYDFWTPLIIDYTSAIATSSTNLGWSATTKTWDNTGLEAITFGITHTMRNKGQNGQIDVFFIWIDGYRRLVEQVRPKERIIIQRGSKASGLQTLGFSDVFNWDGVEVTSEFDVTTGVGYGFNFNFCEWRNLQGQMFVPIGPDFDISTQTDRFSLDMFGNLKFDSPRNFCALKALT